VVAIDAKKVSAHGEPLRWEIFTHADAARPASTRSNGRGAWSATRREILLTSMDRDGTKDGFDIALTRTVSEAVAVPVIASGGVGNLQHLVDGVLDGHATRAGGQHLHFGNSRSGRQSLHGLLRSGGQALGLGPHAECREA